MSDVPWKPGERAEMPSFVYVIGTVCGLKKIGRSYRPWRRLTELRKQFADELEIIDLFLMKHIYTNLVEKLAHRRLAEFQVRREWFDVPLEVAQKTLRDLTRENLEDYHEIKTRRWALAEWGRGAFPILAEWPPP